METTFKPQPQSNNPFQSIPEPVYNSASPNKQRPSTNTHYTQPSRGAEYPHEYENSYNQEDDLERDPESEQEENSEDYDDRNVSFASPEDEGESREKAQPRGRNFSKEEQDRNEDSHDAEVSPDSKQYRDQELLDELNEIKEELTQNKEAHRTGSFQSTPSKYHKKCTDMSPRTILHHFRDYSPNRVVTEDEFKEYYEKFCIAFLKRKEEELLKKRKEKSDLELAELQDRPTLISKPNSRKYIPLMDRTPLLDAKRAREIEKLKQERDEKLAKELEELTFKPKINERSKSICSPNKEDRSRSRPKFGGDLSPAGTRRVLFKPQINYNSNNIAKGIINNTSDDVVDRLYLRADKDNNKRSELAKQLTPNFTPALNRKSQRIIQQIDENQRISSQYQSAGSDSKYRSNSNKRAQEADDDIYTIDQASDTDLLEILRQFNQMLRQKNESPINLEQLSALMASYADKRRNELIEPRLTTEEDDSESASEQGDEDQVPYFPNPASRRCETEVSEKKTPKEKELKSRPKDNVDSNEAELAKIHQNLQQLQDNLKGIKKQGSNINSPPKKQNSVKILEQKGSRSPKKDGNLLTHLIKNPKANNKNDDPPVVPIRDELRQRVEELAAEKAASPKKGLSPKKGDAKTKSTTKGSKDVTPKGKATPSQKSFASASQKTSGTSGTKTKGKKGTKKGKNSKGKESTDKDGDEEKSTKKSKKSQDGMSSKNVLEGWRSPPQELQDANDEEVFLNSQNQDENEEHVSKAENQEGGKNTERPAEQTFGTDQVDVEEIPRDSETNISRKSISSQKGKDQVGSRKDTSFENSKAGKSRKGSEVDKSRKESEADKSFNEQEQFVEIERENVMEREVHGAEKAKTRAVVPRSRGASEYSRSQMSKAVLEEEDEEDKGSDGKDGHETIRSHGQVGSRNKVESNKSSMNQLDDDVKSQKSASQRDGSTGPIPKTNKSKFSTQTQNPNEERNSIMNNVNNVNNIYNTTNTNNQDHHTGANVSRQQEVTDTNASFDSDNDYSESQSTIQEGSRLKGDSRASLSTNKQHKKSFDDQAPSLSNKTSKKSDYYLGAPAEFKSPKTNSEHAKGDSYASFSTNKNDQQRGLGERPSRDLTSPRGAENNLAAVVLTEPEDVDPHRRSRRNAPLRCEVMNTETIQIQPPHQTMKQHYKYAMDGSDKNLTSASSRGLKQLAEHVVKKFKNYDQQIKQTKKEYKVEVSRSESRSRSPEAQEPIQTKKTPVAHREFKTPEKKAPVVSNEFKTPEKRELNRFEKEENVHRDTSAQKKTRASVFVPVLPETGSGKKTGQVKRHSIAVPMKHAFGK